MLRLFGTLLFVSFIDKRDSFKVLQSDVLFIFSSDHVFSAVFSYVFH